MNRAFRWVRVLAATAVLSVNVSTLAQSSLQGVIGIEGNTYTFRACGYGTESVALIPSPVLAKLIVSAKNERKYKAAGGASQYYIYAKIRLQYVHDRRTATCIGRLYGVTVRVKVVVASVTNLAAEYAGDPPPQ